MSTFRCGSYTTFLQIGKTTFQDNLKLLKTGNGLNIERIRKSNSLFGLKKFNKYERNFLAFNFIDDKHHQLGGKLKVHTNEFNFAQLKSHSYYQYGYFTDDKLVFAKFNTNDDLSTDEGPRFSEIIKSSINNTDLIVRHNYEIVGNTLEYRMEINPNLKSLYHEDVSTPNDDSSICGELVPKLPLSFSERLFIQLGKN